MKKTVFVILAAIICITGCKTNYSVTTDKISVNNANNLMDHGKILTYSICGQCHLNPVSHTFIGRQLTDIPPFVGKVFSHNLTASTNYGIADYTDAELFYLIKTGINRKGILIPYMTRPNIADADLKSIIAYLHSNDDPVRAKDTIVGITHYTFIGNIGMNSAKPMPYQTGIAAPDTRNEIDYGKYLVDQIGCYHCHSKSLLKLNALQPEKTPGYMAGGEAERMPNGKTIYASNLTPDNETGMGKYTEAEFKTAVRAGTARDGRKLKPPMLQFQHLSDGQIAALYAYLKNLPPVKHKVKIVKD
jgi:hypothetical protein